MAYKIKRKKRIKEELELCDENGVKVDSILIDFDIDEKSKAFNAARNEVLKIEMAFKEAEEKDLETLQINYGDALLKLFEVIFGHEGAKKVVDFYDNRWVEMTEEVIPFIQGVFMPELTKRNQEKMESLKAKYAR